MQVFTTNWMDNQDCTAYFTTIGGTGRCYYLTGRRESHAGHDIVQLRRDGENYTIWTRQRADGCLIQRAADESWPK